MTKKKFLGFLALIILIVVLGAAYLIGYKFTGTWDVRAWGKGNITQGDQSDNDIDIDLTAGGYSAIDENGNLMRSGVVYSMPNGFTFLGETFVTETKSTARSAVSETIISDGQSVTISATVTPFEASDTRVIWTSDNPYVVVTPQVEYSKIATVTLVNYSSSVFSQDAATITCTSYSDPEKYATCIVSRLATNDEVVLRTEFIPSALSYGNSITASGWGESKESASCLRVGNVTNLVVENISLVYNSPLFNRITQILKAENINYDFASYYYDYDIGKSTFIILTPYDMFGGDIDRAKFNNAFISACKDINGQCSVDVVVQFRAEYVFNGVSFGSLTSRETCSIDFSSLWVDVGGVEIDGNIVIT